MKNLVNFGFQAIVLKDLKNIGCVLNKRCSLGWKVFPDTQLAPINCSLKRKTARLKYLGVIVWCFPLPIQASFFSHQWIEKSEQGLKVFGESIPLASLLKEWCDVCQKQCVIDIDHKQKISLSVDKSNCDALYPFLSSSLTVDVIGNVYWFQKEPKGLWLSYACRHRKPSEILSALKLLLSPLGKYDHVVADDASSTLWLPKRFYENHKELIEDMDKAIAQYNLHLSWLKVSSTLINQSYIDDQELWGWLSGKNKIISFAQFMTWLRRYQDHGKMTLLSKLDLRLRSGETLKAKLQELLPVERRDKKGSLYWKEVLQGAEISVKTALTKDGLILLTIQLRDENEASGIAKQASIAIENAVSLALEETVILSGFLQNRSYQRRECSSRLSQIPFFGRLFCHYQKEEFYEKYILVVSLA